MCDNMPSENDVAVEAFSLLFNAFALKNRSFRPEIAEGAKRFKAHQKKFYILFCINSKKNCTLSDLEKMMVENRSTASAAVSKLYHAGLIDKSQPEKGDDGRKVYFKVTEKGKEILDMFHDYFIREVKNFYCSLADEKKQHFVNGIVCLNKVFGD